MVLFPVEMHLFHGWKIIWINDDDDNDDDDDHHHPLEKIWKEELQPLQKTPTNFKMFDDDSYNLF